MNEIKQSHSYENYFASEWAHRAMVVTVVLAAHLLVLAIGSRQPELDFPVKRELAVSFAMPHQVQTKKSMPQTLPKQAPVVESPQAEQPIQAIPEMVEQAAVETSPISDAPAPLAAVIEPDYNAAYLNNPVPTYPMAARHMGIQGKVLLNVEVLAAGVCGQVTIQKSSGYDMLDNAAIQTVKSWRFTPATQAGHAVDKWFLIPIQFSLRDNTK